MPNKEQDQEQDTSATDRMRRKVLGAGAAAIAASSLKLDGVVAQTVSTAPQIKPSTVKLVEREVTFRSGDTQIKAFQAEPATRPKAALTVIHEIFGLNAHIRDVARRFARQGYVVLAPDLFTREGTPNLDTSDRAALMAFIASIPDRRVVADLEAAAVYLQLQGAERVGCMGFCMGGLYAYLMACKSDRIHVAVDFYGRIVYPETSDNKPESPLHLASQLKCPLLCHFGEQDASIPLSDVEKLRKRLGEGTQPWKVNVYPGAGHAFFNNTRPAFMATAAADAGTETVAFLKQHLQTGSK